jgi:hypothetical protein
VRSVSSSYVQASELIPKDLAVDDSPFVLSGTDNLQKAIWDLIASQATSSAGAITSDPQEMIPDTGYVPDTEYEQILYPPQHTFAQEATDSPKASEGTIGSNQDSDTYFSDGPLAHSVVNYLGI